MFRCETQKENEHSVTKQFTQTQDSKVIVFLKRRLSQSDRLRLHLLIFFVIFSREIFLERREQLPRRRHVTCPSLVEVKSRTIRSASTAHLGQFRFILLVDFVVVVASVVDLTAPEKMEKDEHGEQNVDELDRVYRELRLQNKASFVKMLISGYQQKPPIRRSFLIRTVAFRRKVRDGHVVEMVDEDEFGGDALGANSSSREEVVQVPFLEVICKNRRH